MRESTYRRYLLGLLLTVFAFNGVDRLALGLVLQEIKIEFALTDTQLGLLTGLAFAFFYSVLGIPIARWADRGNRVLVITLTTGLWSAAVALCAAAGNFATLLLIRSAVAVGEAGCIPPAHSLIADNFSRTQRPRAMSIYMLGGPLSSVIGNLVAGWLNQLYGWRLMFVALGVPGLILAPLAWLTLSEPRHGSRERRESVAQSGLIEACSYLWCNTTYRHILLALSIVSFFGAGVGQWQATFLIRTYGMGTAELGAWFTAIYGLGGIMGTFLGGHLASRYAPRNEGLQLRAMALVHVGFAVVSAVAYLASTKALALALIAVTALGGAACAGPLFAAIQGLVPDRLRAMSIALIYLCSNLLGLGLGSVLVGSLSDALRSTLHDASLRYALVALCPGFLWAGWHLARAGAGVSVDGHTKH